MVILISLWSIATPSLHPALTLCPQYRVAICPRKLGLSWFGGDCVHILANEPEGPVPILWMRIMATLQLNYLPSLVCWSVFHIRQHNLRVCVCVTISTFEFKFAVSCTTTSLIGCFFLLLFLFFFCRFLFFTAYLSKKFPENIFYKKQW